ncbi:hypothetical protein RchiOBHm_Chr3g0480011 [Rosa chinensis]|uniref:Uncharacterized protein n=1 Tax=Rosa chinensis TaxID=74649 RepID=A0A2P6RDK8_ROSCH|nr:hypothetical protein RchiOBHm_Chr3g0480011 [Rosa chinensis]
MTIIQQRSPVVKGMMIEFAKNSVDYVTASAQRKEACYCVFKLKLSGVAEK